MKLPSFFACCVLLLMTHFNLPKAQTGIRAGIALADIGFLEKGQSPFLSYDNNSVIHNLPLLTYEFGLVSKIHLSSRFDLQGEITYTRKGLDYSTNFLYDDITYKVVIDYLQLPVLFRYKSLSEKSWKSGFLIGPYAAVKLKSRKLIRLNGLETKETMNNIHDLDYGIIAAYYMVHSLGNDQLQIDFRFGYSLFNMMDHTDGFVRLEKGPDKAYARNLHFALSASYFIDKIDLLNRNKS